MKRLSIAIVFALACVACVGCRNKSPQERADELAQAKAFAETVSVIRNHCQSETPDWNAVSTSLSSIQTLLQGCDTRFDTTYDADLNAAVQLCSNGEDVAVNSQVIVTKLEIVAVTIIREQLEFMPMYDERQHANELIAAYFEAIRFRLKKCDATYFKDTPFLEREAEESIKYLDASQGSDFIMAVEDMQNIILRTYALTIFHEVEAVEANPEGPDAKAALKRAELFYGILSARFQLLARDEHSTVTTALTGEPAAVKLKDVEAAIQNGLGQGFLLR